MGAIYFTLSHGVQELLERTNLCVPSDYGCKQWLTADFGFLPCPSVTLAVVMGTTGTFLTHRNSCMERDCCAVSIHILVGQLGLGHGSHLYNTN